MTIIEMMKLAPGTRVAISDGTLKPTGPDPDTRRMAHWRSTNYTGVIAEVLDGPKIVLVREDAPIEITRWIDFFVLKTLTVTVVG